MEYYARQPITENAEMPNDIQEFEIPECLPCDTKPTPAKCVKGECLDQGNRMKKK